jgi:uncharacterized protein YciI
MDRLFEGGRIVLGGPYADESRALVIVQASSAGEASQLFRDDPWTRDGILVAGEIVEWAIFLDSRETSRQGP